jgi:O-acetyl-ADP-ribose deacetylase (regulator of RNase III)
MPGKTITCKRGDITESYSDAIVNAANNHLWMGSGVAGAIRQKGGESIEIEAMAKGPIPVGEAVATTAGKLHARYVIHAAAMGQDLRTDENKIGGATKNALLRAEELKLSSIDFPALGTGAGGFPITLAAKTMIDTAKDFLKISRSINRIGFILFDEAAFMAFKEYLGGENIEI